MKALANLVLVAGFCLGTLGAAGFRQEAEPGQEEATPERGAWPTFLGGLALLAVGGVLVRRSRTGGQDAEVVHGERERYRRLVVSIRDEVVALEEALDSSPPDAIRERIDALLRGELFDLTSAHEDVLAVLGFDAYARIWEGVAGGERLLARAWSMLTDDAPEEGLAEVPLARAQLDRAVVAFEHA